MKKLVSLAATLFLALSLSMSTVVSAEAQEPIKKSELLKGFKISLILNSEKTDMQIILNHYLAQLCEDAGADLTVVNADGDIAAQAQLIEDCIVQQPDLVFLKPLDGTALASSVKKLNEAGIPVITYDMAMAEDADCHVDCMVNTDQESCGHLAAEYFKSVADETGETLKVIEVLGDMSTNIPLLRGPQSFEADLETYDNVELVAATEAKWDASKAYDVTIDMLTAHPEANAIFSHSDCLSQGIVQALTDLGRLVPAGEEGHMYYASVDGEAIGCQHVQEGYLDQISNNNPHTMCTLAFWAAVDILHGYEVPEELLFPATPINADNVDTAWGLTPIDTMSTWGWDDTESYVLQTAFVEE